MSDTSRQSWFRKTLVDQPALFISVLYLFASLIGLVYSWAFLRSFGIDVMQYSEVGDFLLASLKEPVIWLLVIVTVALIQGDSALSRRVQRRGPGRWMRWYGSERYRKVNYLVSALMVLAVLLVYADASSKKVRDGGGDEFRLELADGSPATQQVLLGTTVNYVFVYDPASERVSIHPSENVLALSILVPKVDDQSGALPEQEGSQDDASQADDSARDRALDQGDAQAQK